MQELDAQEIITQIIQQALENKPLEPYQLNTWAEYFFYVDQKRSLKAILRVLRFSATSIFSIYLKEISQGTQDVNKLLAYKQFKDITAYYKQELKTITYMLDDFENYIIMGGFINCLLGIPRGE